MGGPEPVEPVPLSELAQEIRRAVDRFVTDDAADPASLAAALDALPRQELAAIARVAFDRLEPLQQWAVLERVLGERGAVDALAVDQRDRLGSLRREAAAAHVVAEAVEDDVIDLTALPAGVELSIGLFRPGDVRAASGRGRLSDVCARQLVVLATSTPGTFRVVDDVFNPRGGLFVSAEYDLSVWSSERLDSHSAARLGSLAGADADSLEPVLRRGARVDVVAAERTMPGRLRLGWATVDDVDAFGAPG
ncbi:hypothetical protein [Dermatobacter hominis]|uniref:hypothetical protein n=1 Tax=Dermatobacter hominis TaxID=2884263 RepID=UPI001D129C58|nr:hypothetical protein [Dermatobacter hominis]UDY35683.1 hypothetical protein LH044_20450 [Dermatobacter hominis]